MRRLLFPTTPLPELALCLASFASAGCGNDQPTGPSTEAAVVTSDGQGAARLGVLTRNLYVGADLDAVLAALASPSPADDLPALLAAVETVQETHWPGRAAALADEIAKSQPHFVGLQEVSTIDIDLTGLGLPVAIHQDFLATLLAELSARGVSYAVGAAVQNIEASPLPGISVVDRDVLLVDAASVEVLAKVEANFTANLPPVAPGVVLKRGWVAVTATLDGRVLTVASTHLESGESAQLDQLRAAQALELVTALGTASPAILMGDLNDIPGSPMYEVVTAAGFTDVWAVLRPAPVGFTCCHLPDLSNRVEAFHERIDYVMARDLTGSGGNLLGRVAIVGDEPSSLVPGPLHRLWPSDHAGVLAEILSPAAEAPSLASSR